MGHPVYFGFKKILDPKIRLQRNIESKKFFGILSKTNHGVHILFVYSDDILFLLYFWKVNWELLHFRINVNLVVKNNSFSFISIILSIFMQILIESLVRFSDGGEENNSLYPFKAVQSSSSDLSWQSVFPSQRSSKLTQLPSKQLKSSTEQFVSVSLKFQIFSFTNKLDTYKLILWISYLISHFWTISLSERGITIYFVFVQCLVQCA